MRNVGLELQTLRSKVLLTEPNRHPPTHTYDLMVSGGQKAGHSSAGYPAQGLPGCREATTWLHSRLHPSWGRTYFGLTQVAGTAKPFAEVGPIPQLLQATYSSSVTVFDVCGTAVWYFGLVGGCTQLPVFLVSSTGSPESVRSARDNLPGLKSTDCKLWSYLKHPFTEGLGWLVGVTSNQ